MPFIYFSSSIGNLIIEGSNSFINKIQFADYSSSASQKATLIHPVTQQDWPLGNDAIQQLSEYFAGKRTEFNLPLQPQGTNFQLAVWKALQEIPYGETRSYGDIAKEIGKPKAARAVGQANNRNPMAIVIPCHRVIGANKKLTGYAGGLERKEYLLDLER